MSFDPTYWHWLALACALLVIEIAVPIAFFLWLSIAAACTALVAYLLPDLSWQLQALLFSALCIVSMFAWHRFAKDSKPSNTDQPNLNQRYQGYIGRTLILSQAIVNGVGKVRVEDSQWQVRGTDADVGSQVKVIAVEGSYLLVEPIQG